MYSESEESTGLTKATCWLTYASPKGSWTIAVFVTLAPVMVTNKSPSETKVRAPSIRAGRGRKSGLQHLILGHGINRLFVGLLQFKQLVAQGGIRSQGFGGFGKQRGSSFLNRLRRWLFKARCL